MFTEAHIQASLGRALTDPDIVGTIQFLGLEPNEVNRRSIVIQFTNYFSANFRAVSIHRVARIFRRYYQMYLDIPVI